MQKTYYFLRSAPYAYTISGMNLYQSFNAVAKREVSPSLLEKYTHAPLLQLFKSRGITTVFSSPRERSIQTAKVVDKKVEVLETLAEVGYRMEDFISEEEFYHEGKPDVISARKAFVHGLIENKLQENYQHVISRIESLLQFLYDHPSCEGLLFSHGFYLKIIEVFVRDPKIKEQPERLLTYFSGEVETFHFCEGFVISLAETPQFLQYIREESNDSL